MKKLLLVLLVFVSCNIFSQKVLFQEYSFGDSYSVVKSYVSSNIIKDFPNEVLVSLNKIQEMPDIITFNSFDKDGRLGEVVYYFVADVSNKYTIIKQKIYNLYGIPTKDDVFAKNNEIGASLTQWNFKDYSIWLTIETSKKEDKVVMRLTSNTNKYFLSKSN